MADIGLPRGVVPPGTYAKGERSPVVYVLLCPPCAGYAPMTDEDYSGFLSGRCQGCGADSRELHRFQALILSAANGGCMCTSQHRQVTGDLPAEWSALAVMMEVQTRPRRTGGNGEETADGLVLPQVTSVTPGPRVVLLSAVPGPSRRRPCGGCVLISQDDAAAADAVADAAELVVNAAVALALRGFAPRVTHENGPYLYRLAELMLAELGVAADLEALEADGG